MRDISAGRRLPPNKRRGERAVRVEAGQDRDERSGLARSTRGWPGHAAVSSLDAVRAFLAVVLALQLPRVALGLTLGWRAALDVAMRFRAVGNAAIFVGLRLVIHFQKVGLVKFAVKFRPIPVR